MATRGSLTQCVAIAVDRFRRGVAKQLLITHNEAGKYYTLLTPAEYEVAVHRIQETGQRLVLNVTGGELSHMIGTAQQELKLKGPNAHDQKSL